MAACCRPAPTWSLEGILRALRELDAGAYQALVNGWVAAAGSGDLGAWERYVNWGTQDSAGSFLTIQPFVGLDSTEMFVSAVVRSVTGYTPQGTPMMAERSITTSVRTQDGERLVLAGLTRTEKVKQKAGIPILSEIPILGYLFGGETTVDRTTDVVVTLDTTTTVGAENKLELPEDVETVIAQASGDVPVEIPDNPFGFDQWLLDDNKR